MTPDQVELVAQAFYGAEYPGDWGDASEALQEQFRDLARTAILLLHRQTSRSLLSSLIMAKVLEPAREDDVVQLPS
ncbi:hypothetical protein KBI52_28955 [Microvirga sp. HBU67558]|uniref:hypothetical protein n=1 Tax=Microvirga TaxID=186650 RepID=UPI001B36C427|nr:MULTISPECIES: hypothetical protein [unclassified Microvirga]MBQ0824231.1 hypothetical protein [Microvirga sp. HBU67558]